QHECTASYLRSELVILVRNFPRCQKSVASDQRSFEKKNAEREPDERHESRTLDGQADVARAEPRPQPDRECDDRQHKEDGNPPKCRGLSRAASREQPEHRSTDCA